MISVLIVLLCAVAGVTDQGSCDATAAAGQGSCSEAAASGRLGRRLRPSDLASLQIYNHWKRNHTITLSNRVPLEVAEGAIKRSADSVDKKRARESRFAVLKGVVERSTVEAVLALVDSNGAAAFDEDPDTVDGMATYEMFINQPQKDMKASDREPAVMAAREPLRQKLQALTASIVEEKITPFVEQHLGPDACGKGPGRRCTACYSLIRRYRRNERQSHATHYDGHAIATVVIGLSDYGQDFQGGLYVATAASRRMYVALQKGDAVVHRSNLLHGVKVFDLEDRPEDTVRWSWIIWYRDSDTCVDHSHEWFAGCAQRRDPTCQLLHATKVGNVPGIKPEQAAKSILELNTAGADGGEAKACIKVARAYLKTLPSALPKDTERAEYYFLRAVEVADDPDGHYGLAGLYLQRMFEDGTIKGSKSYADLTPSLNRVVSHLEKAALGGHEYAMFNLGIAHIFGYTDSGADPELSGSWFEQSGIPEGYFARAMQLEATGKKQRADEIRARAIALGFGKPWRRVARENTGSGGAGGVSLNLPWPPNAQMKRPPEW